MWWPGCLACQWGVLGVVVCRFASVCGFPQPLYVVFGRNYCTGFQVVWIRPDRVQSESVGSENVAT